MDTRVGISPEIRQELERLENEIGGAGYELPAATPNALGGVKQAEAVSDAAGDTVTTAEFGALLAALRAAGIIAAG